MACRWVTTLGAWQTKGVIVRSLAWCEFGKEFVDVDVSGILQIENSRCWAGRR